MKRSYLAVAGLVALLWTTLYCVDQTQLAVVTAFGRTGRVVATVERPGLHAKWPWQGRRKFDRRLRLYNARPSECLTADKKNLVVDWYVCWQITEPARYFASVRSQAIAEQRLEETVRGELTAAIGRTPLDNLVNLREKGGVTIDALTSDVEQAAATTAAASYGIAVRDVRLRRLNLPVQNKQSVFDRMRAERERIARQYRAEGEEQARRIRADADLERETILSQAERDAERLRGEGDARATRIFAAAHNADPAFYQFLRTLDAYEKILGPDTTVVLSADSPLLRTLSGGAQPGAAR